MRQGTRAVAILGLLILIGIGGLVYGDAVTPNTPSPLGGAMNPYTFWAFLGAILAPFLGAAAGILGAIDAARTKRVGWSSGLAVVTLMALAASISLLIILAITRNSSQVSVNVSLVVPWFLPPTATLAYLLGTRNARATSPSAIG